MDFDFEVVSGFWPDEDDEFLSRGKFRDARFPQDGAGGGPDFPVQESIHGAAAFGGDVEHSLVLKKFAFDRADAAQFFARVVVLDVFAKVKPALDDYGCSVAWA